MSWLVLLALGAGPLDDVEAMHSGARAGEATVVNQPSQKSSLPAGICTFTPRVVNDPAVTWQWLAACPAENVQLEVVRGVAGVRLFTQTSVWKLLAFDGKRAAEFDDPSPRPPVAPPWVPAEVVSGLLAALHAPGRVVAIDPKDGSRITIDYQRGYERVGKDGVARPAFTPDVAPSPLHAVWFTSKEREPWLFWSDDPRRKLELTLRAPNGTSTTLFSRAARVYGGDYRLSDLTQVLTREERPVFSMLADHRHLVLWPRADGTFAPLVHGVANAGEPPPLPSNVTPPCGAKPQAGLEENVVAPRLFLIRGAPWLAYLSQETEVAWRLAPVLHLGKDESAPVKSCDWVPDRRAFHTSLVLAKFDGLGHLEEKKRLPIVGTASQLSIDARDDTFVAVTTANGFVTVTRVDLPR